MKKKLREFLFSLNFYGIKDIAIGVINIKITIVVITINIFFNVLFMLVLLPVVLINYIKGVIK